MFQMIIHSIATVLAGVVLSSGSCITVIDTPPPGNGGGNGNGGGGTTETLRIVIINDSPWALDPQLFATSAALGDPEQMLFIGGNQVTTGIGFAGGGLVPGGETDEVTLDCEEAITIGTRGGRFLNPDTGTLIGAGEQRVAGIQISYECADVITLRYRADGETFSTSLQVE